MICPQCGKQATGHFCSECGARLPQDSQAAPPMPPSAASAPSPTPSGALAGPPVSSVREPPAPAAVPAAPATPLLSHFGLVCPVCAAEAMHETDVKGLFRTKRELVCGRCGSIFVDQKGDYQHFELTETANPAAEHWQLYKHKTLSTAEWRRIASGGLSTEAQSEADLAEAMTELRQGRVHLQPQTASPILARAGELTLFVLPNVSLHEPRSVTRGAYGGPSVHVAKGVTLRVGGFQAQSHEELKEIDSGTLVLTNKRLCFSGGLRSLEIDLRKLISVDPYADAVAVRRSGKEKTEFFFGLEHHAYGFVVQGRRYSEPMSGLILKYAIEGLLAAAG